MDKQEISKVLKHMLSTKKNKISEPVLEKMIIDMDTDSNGTISKDELLKMFLELEQKKWNYN